METLFLEMFPRLRAHATFVEEAKMFLNIFRNILLPRQMFPRLPSKEAKTIALLPARLRIQEIFRETMFPRLRGP